MVPSDAVTDVYHLCSLCSIVSLQSPDRDAGRKLGDKFLYVMYIFIVCITVFIPVHEHFNRRHFKNE